MITIWTEQSLTISTTTMHRFSLPLVFFISTMQLSACTSVPTYVEPVDQPQAKVRFILTNPDKYYGHLHTVDLKTCKISTAIGWLNGGKEIDSVRIGMIDSPPIREGIIERRVIAGQRVTVIPTFLMPTWKWVYILKAAQSEFTSAQPWQCEAPMFVPEADAQYEYSITPGPGTCDIAVHKLELTPSRQVLREKMDLSHEPAIVVGHPEIECPKQFN